MSNKDLYKRTFSQIHASEDTIMEVIKMKDTTKKRTKRYTKMLCVAACAACLLSAGVVANAATDGSISKSIVGWFVNSDGEKTAIEGEVTTDENGRKVTTAELDKGVTMQSIEDEDSLAITIKAEGDEDFDNYRPFMFEVTDDGEIIVNQNKDIFDDNYTVNSYTVTETND